jgi:hypothetical protein
MVSIYVKKIAEMPYKALLLVAIGIVFLCQLAALVLVAQGQVEKAYLRDVQAHSAQRVLEDCSEVFSDAAQSRCIEQVNVALQPPLTHADEPFQKQAMAQGDTSNPASSVQSFMPALFPDRK